jgi:hypothetical protein
LVGGTGVLYQDILLCCRSSPTWAVPKAYHCDKGLYLIY